MMIAGGQTLTQSKVFNVNNQQLRYDKNGKFTLTSGLNQSCSNPKQHEQITSINLKMVPFATTYD